MSIFAELLPSGGCLYWFHSSGFQQICHSIIPTLLDLFVMVSGLLFDPEDGGDMFL
jgi:hypothetical protein